MTISKTPNRSTTAHIHNTLDEAARARQTMLDQLPRTSAMTSRSKPTAPASNASSSKSGRHCRDWRAEATAGAWAASADPDGTARAATLDSVLRPLRGAMKDVAGQVERDTRCGVRGRAKHRSYLVRFPGTFLQSGA